MKKHPSDVPSPFLLWIAHRLRLVGRVSARQAARAFGVNARQFRRWMEQYEEYALHSGHPAVRPFRLPWGRGSDNPTYDAIPVEGEVTDFSQSQAIGEGHIFPVASALVPNTRQAVDLLDAWRAHGILARISPQVFGDDVFLDAQESPLVEEVGVAIHPRLDGDTIPVLLRALVLRQAVSMDYVTKQGQSGPRVFSPHRFIFAQGRYHVRGYEANKKMCVDLNPSRATSCVLLPGARYWGSEYDKDWMEIVTLRFVVFPSVRAVAHYWNAIRQTFSVNEQGVMEIKVRRPMAYYARLQLLNYALRDDRGQPFLVFQEV